MAEGERSQAQSSVRLLALAEQASSTLSQGLNPRPAPNWRLRFAKNWIWPEYA